MRLLIQLPKVAAIVLLGQLGFRTHSAGFGITIGLPASWRADSGAQLSKAGEGLSELRDLATSNPNVLLFRARDSLAPANSISLNLTASTDMRPSAFRSATPDELDRMVKGLCGRFSAQLKQNGGGGRCLGHEVRTLVGRPVLVIQQEATMRTLGLDNRRIVALFPADGLLFTLNYSVDKAGFDPAVARAILASFQLPGG